MESAIRGACNMLQNCASAKSGERLLIAYEPADFCYYEADALACVCAAAKQLAMEVTLFDVGFSPNNPQLTPELHRKMASADITVFLARLGDQLRFSQMPDGHRIVVSYALSAQMFASGFGNAHHGGFDALKEAVNKAFEQAKDVRVTCRNGTEFSGRPEMDLTAGGDTSILRFPLSVFTPVPAHSFSGKVSVSGFLTGTGSMYYDPSTITFKDPVLALFKNGRLTGFEGTEQDITHAEQHYDFVAEKFGIDRDFVHSWHAGIHPGCDYPWQIKDSYERWSGAAFGNPRLLHFHTCGAYPPGEICWNVVDPTVEIDNVKLWEDGIFRVDRLSGGPEILAQFPCAAALFSAPSRNIGMAL